MFNPFKKQKKEPETLQEVISYLKDLENYIEKFSGELNQLKTEANFAIQKVGMVRFNPFSGVGSDQSFSVALLDQKYDGIVITSLYSREGNRIYAKPVKSGNSEYLLSDEEKEAINRAKGSDIPTA
jgi:hypothetical protein